MGWVYVDYGVRHVHLHDMQLWALRHFLANASCRLAVESPNVLFAEAGEFFASWDCPGPGIVTGTDLGRFVRGEPERVRALVRVCDHAIARLRTFGEMVPLAYLVAHINLDSSGGVYTVEQPTAGFIRGVEGIRELLVPHAETGSEMLSADL